MWLRAFGAVGWWFASGSLGLLAAIATASLAPRWSRTALWTFLGLWVLGCAIAVAAKKLDLDGTFFRHRARRLYKRLRWLIAEATAAIAARQPEVRESELEWQLSRFFRGFYQPLDAMARETERRYNVPPVPHDLGFLRPLTIADVERTAEWLWQVGRSAARSR